MPTPDEFPTHTELMAQLEKAGTNLFADSYEFHPPGVRDSNGKPLINYQLSFLKERGAELSFIGGPDPIVSERLILTPVREDHILRASLGYREWRGNPEATGHRLSVARQIGRTLMGPQFDAHSLPPEAIMSEYRVRLKSGQSWNVTTPGERSSPLVFHAALRFMDEVVAPSDEIRKSWLFKMAPTIAVSGEESTAFLEEFYFYLRDERDEHEHTRSSLTDPDEINDVNVGLTLIDERMSAIGSILLGRYKAEQ